MCDMNLCRDLENGGGNSMEKQSLALSKIMQTQESQGKTMDRLVKQIADIPTRSEVREMQREGMQIHVESCEHARRSIGAGAAEANKVKLAVGKFLGFEATGKLGMFLSALFWAIVGGVTVWAIANAGELGSLWGGK
mgnify:CR=1 FL=1